MIRGTSFGLPYCKIFKNLEWDENTDSLRIVVGYNSEMIKNVVESTEKGINNLYIWYRKFLIYVL